MLGEQNGEEMHHRLPVLEHVGHAGGRPKIILEDEEAVFPGADDVGADDVGIDLPRRIEADHFGQKGLVVVDQRRGNAARPDDLLPVIDIVEKGVERTHALLDAAFEKAPFGGRDHAGDEVEGDQPLVGLFAPVHGECDAEPPEDRGRLVLLSAHYAARTVREPFGDFGIGRTVRAVRQDHLVVEGGLRSRRISQRHAHVPPT